MSSTDAALSNPEKAKLFETCRRIYDAGNSGGILSAPSPDSESYYCNRSELRQFESEISDYDFSTPVELRTMLQNMWDFQQCAYMKDFAAVVTVATFQNKPENNAQQTAEAIPAFIYNF